MATSMKTARIGLYFEKRDIENSWFLVDYSKHSRIEDVAREIKQKYFQSMTNDDIVVLRINNFLLPACESSVLFRDNDIVSVRLEKAIQNLSQSSTTGSGNHGGDSLTQSSKGACTDTDGNARQISSSQLSLAGLGENDEAYTETDVHMENSESCKKRKSKRHKRGNKKKFRRESLSQDEEKTENSTESSEDLTFSENKKVKKQMKKEKCRENNEIEQYSVTATNGNNNISSSKENSDELKSGVKLEPESRKAKKKSKKEKSEQTIISAINNSDEDEIKSKDKHSKMETSDATESETDTKTDVSQVNEDSLIQVSEVSNNSIVKQKRKRLRKRKRKSTSSLSTADASDTSIEACKVDFNDTCQQFNTYKGRDVDSREQFYGSLPDKLESPKNYRHGYRNMHTYRVEPNVHKKFGSDSEPEDTEENTQQYNFLCKSRKTEETNGDSKSPQLFENIAHNGNVTTETAFIKTIRALADNTICAQDNSHSSFNGINEAADVPNEQSSQNGSYTATPFRYADSSSERSFGNDRSGIQDNTTSSYSSAETSPVSLERKTLSSGVSVFVRQRASPGARFREPSKQEQLNTTATNVSNIFVNPQESEFKVPTSPAPRQKPSPKPCVSTMEDSTSSTEVWWREDYTTLKPLTGAPKPGDMIAYKVLEISVNCTPEVSRYKVAKVLSVDNNQMVKLENLHEPGSAETQKTKFHVEIEDDDEILTNTEDTQDVVSLHLSSMLEPRIISQS